MRSVWLVFLLASFGLLTACATTGPQRSVALRLAAEHVQVQTPSFSQSGIVLPTDLRDEILAAFRTEAAKDGLKLVQTGGIPIVFTVRDYRARNAVARVIVGIFDGRDHLSLLVNCDGQVKRVSDSGYSVYATIHEVAREVGRKAAGRVANILAADPRFRNH